MNMHMTQYVGKSSQQWVMAAIAGKRDHNQSGNQCMCLENARLWVLPQVQLTHCYLTYHILHHAHHYKRAAPQQLTHSKNDGTLYHKVGAQAMQ